MTTNRILSIAAALVAAASFSACSSDSNSNNGVLTTDCTETLSGAVTQTITCNAAVGAYTPQTGLSAIALTSTSSSTIALSVGWTGNVHTGTFRSTDVGAVGAITIASGGNSWAVLPNTTSTATTGSYTVTLTGVTTLSTTATGTGYTIHGTIDATIPRIGGTAGAASVTLHATF